MIKIIFLLFILFYTSLFAQKQYFIISGVVVKSGSNTLTEKFTKYLSQKSDYPLETKFVATYDELSAMMKMYPKSLAWTCGSPFVEDNYNDAQQLVAVPTFNGNATYHSLVVTRKERSERSLMEFNNTIFAYSDSRSNSGYIAPSSTLLNSGTNIRKHFKLLIHSGNHTRSLQAVIHGLCDVATVDEHWWILYKQKNPNTPLKVIQKLGPYPYTPIVAGKGVNQHELTSLQKVLLDMSNEPQGKSILEQYMLESFILKDNTFYHPLQVILEQLGRLTSRKEAP